MSRLRELFDVMTKLEESCDKVGRDREAERKARKYFRKAVKVVVEEEWKGEGTRVWKDLIKKKVKDWATEKYRKPLGKLTLHSCRRIFDRVLTVLPRICFYSSNLISTL
jgi:hypothetical protein